MSHCFHIRLRYKDVKCPNFKPIFVIERRSGAISSTIKFLTNHIEWKYVNYLIRDCIASIKNRTGGFGLTSLYISASIVP